jgi:hypothetical protein
MDDPGEHALVVKALVGGLSNCVLWDGRSAQIVRGDGELKGLTTSTIKAELTSFVKANGGTVVMQILEARPEWREEYKFYYKVILPIEDLKHGLFVEIRLTDDDPDVPTVTLVGAHPQRK